MTLRRTLLVLGTVAGVAFVFVGIVGGYWPGHWDDTGAGDQIAWIVFGVGGGLILLGGLRLLSHSPWAGAALVSAGAVLGALPVFSAIVPLVVALTLVVLSVMYARRAAEPDGPSDASEARTPP
jgi:hypothetical protein